MRNNIRQSKKTLCTHSFLFCWIILAVTPAVSQPPDYEMAIRISHEYPANTEPTFANNIQGVTQDGSYWYVTQTEDLWKFPIGMNWNDVSEGGSVLHTELDDYQDNFPEVHSDYIHMGDLSYHDACGQGLLIIPLHNGGSHPSAMLVLRASDLGAITWQEFPGLSLGAFCAVDDEDVVYFPGPSFETIVGYSLDCNNFHFAYARTCTLQDEGGAPLARHHKQGAVFSPSGDLFVMSTGYGTENSDPVLDGIHVFKTGGSTWTRIAHSTNGYGLFNFMWNPADEEPEGMTWIDLDTAGILGMTGQLHILLLNNDDADSDNIFFKHYTSRIYVDAAYPSGNGTLYTPFPTVGEASALAWDGCEILIRAGSYNESVTFNRRSRISTYGGTVIIGR